MHDVFEFMRTWDESENNLHEKTTETPEGGMSHFVYLHFDSLAK